MVQHRSSTEEEEEGRVEVYDNQDTTPADLQSCKVRPSAGLPRRRFPAAATLGVLYLLISAGVFLRYVLATLDNQTLLTEADRLNASLYEAQTRVLNASAERDQLQTRYDQLQTRYDQLQTRYDQLQTRYDELREKYRQLEDSFSLQWP